jgi:F0F1-type ATP synthase epsilon subunit
MDTQFFTLEIITPTHAEVFSVEWVEIESPTGSFLVGPNHSPLVSMIKNKSTLSYKKTTSEQCTMDIFKGIFRVSDNKAVALLDQS